MKRKEKNICAKLVGIRMAQSKRVTSWGGAIHLFLPTLCLFGHYSVWLLNDRIHEIIWIWIIMFLLMFWNSQLDYCASFTHTHSSQSFMNIDYHTCWVCGCFLWTPCFSQFYWLNIFFLNLIIEPRNLLCQNGFWKLFL